MARRRFRSNQRHEPTTERSFQEYVLSTPAPQTSRTELLRLIRGGEDTFLELKVKLSNTEKVAQEIVALANTGGGVIVFGVNDQMRVEGLDDAESVQDELVRICREEIQPPLVPYIEGDAFEESHVAGYPTKDVLERDLLLATPLGGETVPTVAGILLFGRDERV